MMLIRWIAILSLMVISGCETMPVEGDSEHPTITISQVSRGEITPILSSADDHVFESPDLCPGNRQIIGTVWQVDGFPVELLVSAADPSGILWLRVNSEAGQFIAPPDSSVRVGSRSIAGTDISFARRDYPEDDPRSPAVYSVTLNPKAGESVVDIEGGASDMPGNDGYTLVLSIGTNQALCEAF